MNSYGIGQIYSDRGCEIYYGSKEKVLEKLINSRDRPYGNFYAAEEQMLEWVDFYKSEKPYATFKKI
ncbi:hypothetical protein [Paenibacillus lutrae]|uniref:Uncharacterized protein n=1 Tax=Paenibacillus lutrae TaxID=2078573 RepID=A0A7X3FK48_9BACL|nr:hypothetical protein [Paenibacillus lutrae]MVP00812.1 hypothetical protein [Paenibacillus lutrae]